MTSPLDTLRHTPLTSPVWQCSIRAAPADRTLSDDEWADIAEEAMHQTGFAPRGDDQACRWIAVRHADDHIHLAVVLAREDGRNPNVHRDYYKVADACHIVEERYDLTRTAHADRTAAPRPTRAETEITDRKNWTEPPRTTLRRARGHGSRRCSNRRRLLRRPQRGRSADQDSPKCPCPRRDHRLCRRAPTPHESGWPTGLVLRRETRRQPHPSQTPSPLVSPTARPFF
ncbi:relaxase/mobilization nuclease domain-containing protein [Actinomadura madurae]|uniref:relaxase/mobilization nuclease domain-containing protein n=1 Tax=Actinomadura madurae TaxID=1993 RepID=UPI00355866C3